MGESKGVVIWGELKGVVLLLCAVVLLFIVCALSNKCDSSEHDLQVDKTQDQQQRDQTEQARRYWDFEKRHGQ